MAKQQKAGAEGADGTTGADAVQLEVDASYASGASEPGQGVLDTPFGRLTGSVAAFEQLERAIQGTRRAAGDDVAIPLTADAPYTVERPVRGEAALSTPFGRFTGPASAFQHFERALERARGLVRGGGTPPPRPLYVNEEVVQAAREKAAREHRDFTDVLNEGFVKYLAGDLTLRKPVRAAQRPRDRQGNLPAKKQATCSVRMHQGEWDVIVAHCEVDKRNLGWAVTPSKVITQYLVEVYLAPVAG